MGSCCKGVAAKGWLQRGGVDEDSPGVPCMTALSVHHEDMHHPGLDAKGSGSHQPAANAKAMLLWHPAFTVRLCCIQLYVSFARPSTCRQGQLCT